MKKVIFPLLTVTVMTVMFTACQSPPDEPLKETFRFRRNAVTTQVNNLVADVGGAHVDKKATMDYLVAFINKSPCVAEVTLASIPLDRAPMSVRLSKVHSAAPKPISEHISQRRFDQSEDMAWYRELLRKKIPFWYQPITKPGKPERISYVYPVFNKLNPEIILYILKLDFEEKDNPILFWNVPQKLYEQELLKKEEEFLKKYFLLKKQAEQKELDSETAKKLEAAKAYYEQMFKEMERTEKEMDRLLKEREKNKIEQQKFIPRSGSAGKQNNPAARPWYFIF